MIIKILLAILLGGLIGLDRERHNKPAGIKTNILICLGSVVFATLSLTNTVAPHRLAAQILTGIGFLGGGCILKTEDHIEGVTTAATIWVVSAIGVLIGFGLIKEAIIIGIAVVIILNLVRPLDKLIRKGRK